MNAPLQVLQPRSSKANSIAGNLVFGYGTDRQKRLIDHHQPRYHCREQSGKLKLVVHLPGADPASIDIEISAPDMIIRANRGSAVDEGGGSPLPSDFELCLRLGFGLNYGDLQAEFDHGNLVILIPKKGLPGAE